MSDALIQARALHRTTPAGDDLLADVSLELRAGECLGLTGPAGSGKTLLLRALALLDPLDEGQLLWRGEPVADHDVPAYRAAVVYLHQRPALAGDLSVEANLRRPFALHVHRERRFDRERAVARLQQLGREADFLEKQPAHLSGGERQLVALVRALQLNPHVLLLDEATASLDRAASEAAEGVLGNWLAGEAGGRAMVWVSHEEEQVQRMATRRVAIRAGRLTDG